MPHATLQVPYITCTNEVPYVFGISIIQLNDANLRKALREKQISLLNLKR